MDVSALAAAARIRQVGIEVARVPERPLVAEDIPLTAGKLRRSQNSADVVRF